MRISLLLYICGAACYIVVIIYSTYIDLSMPVVVAVFCVCMLDILPSLPPLSHTLSVELEETKLLI